ncbi:MAG: 23S rRNA (adenine(2030)-N(6))-methyltransferase RlmJ [Alphaproteobacteria bacterium]|nr:23S rRNA (adenine(2030)-N(6))-methyltransferase RlmJ [Alphaproteobacteria bacterium]
MNYRHVYHAGNFADVLKHAVLCWIVRYLQQKEAPLKLLDTHAGAGIYDLTGLAAGKTGEAKDGILRLVNRSDLPPVLRAYLDLVRAANGSAQTISLYPGSTALMTALARKQDSVMACELHPEDAEALSRSVANPRLRIVAGDGYRTLLANVPPPEKRGLVLIDPPFEEPDEFERLAAGFIAAHRKWPTGVYILWFPLKHADDANRFKAELQSSGIKKLTLVTLDVARAEGLSATGLILCNAPFTFEAEWRPALAWLAEALAQGSAPQINTTRLSGE